MAISTTILLALAAVGCGVKTEYLPQVNHPYVSEMDFLKEVKNVNGKARKKRFTDERIIVPFYFLLKVNEIENNGTVAVRFYDTRESGNPPGNSPGTPGQGGMGRQAVERVFQFGQAGKYYEYVMFFDQVEGLSPGKYRYAVFYNDKLIYENFLEINAVTFP